MRFRRNREIQILLSERERGKSVSEIRELYLGSDNMCLDLHHCDLILADVSEVQDKPTESQESIAH